MNGVQIFGLAMLSLSAITFAVGMYTLAKRAKKK